MIVRFCDDLPDETTRTRLFAPLLPSLLNTVASPEMERRRAFVCADWAIHSVAPFALDLVSETSSHAAGLRALPAVVDYVTGRTAGDICWAAARAARAARLVAGVDRDAGVAAWAAWNAAAAARATRARGETVSAEDPREPLWKSACEFISQLCTQTQDW